MILLSGMTFSEIPMIITGTSVIQVFPNSNISLSHTWLITLIRFITSKNNWINPCMKTEGKCNESVNNEFKIMRESNSLHQIMKVSK